VDILIKREEEQEEEGDLLGIERKELFFRWRLYKAACFPIHTECHKNYFLDERPDIFCYLDI